MVSQIISNMLTSPGPFIDLPKIQISKQTRVMEDKKHGGSASSFTAQLFGAIESTPSSKGHFESIFPPPKVFGKSSSCLWQKQNQTWNNDLQGTSAMSKEGGKKNFQQSMEPCHLSSSLYYGGREMYTQSPCTQNSGLQHAFRKDTDDDDQSGNQAQSASRGNWWQGSLYY